MARSADGGGSSVTLTPTQIALKKALAAQKVAQNAVNNVAKKGTPKQKLVAAEKLRLARSATAFATSNNDATLTFGTASEETNFLMEAAESQAATGNAQATLADDGTAEQTAQQTADEIATNATNATTALIEEGAVVSSSKTPEEIAAGAAAAQAKVDAANFTLAQAQKALQDLINNQAAAATAAQLATAKAALEAANAATAEAAAQLAATKAAAETAAKTAADKAAADAAAATAATTAAAKAAEDKAAADAKTAADALAAAIATGNAAAIAAAKTAKDAADKAAAEAKAAADKAIAEAKAAADKAIAEAKATAAAQVATAAAASTNVTGNTVIPGPYATAADIAAAIDRTTAAAAAKADQAAAQQKADTAAALEAKKIADRTSVIETMKVRFKQYNLGSLADKITSLAIDGANEATITLALQETEEYKKRFSANEARLKNNLKVLSPSDYLNLEDGYRQVMKTYGLTQFDNDEYVSKFIANDTSAPELNKRITAAVDRIQNADPSIAKTLRDYYKIKDTDLVAYILDPEKNIDKLQKQISAAEIGSAAGRQGLTAGLTVAEQLAAQGVTQAEAQKGYATIADILPGAEKLSNIYGKTQDIYGQTEGEQEVFNSLASAQRKRQRLDATERGTFGASSGMSRASLTGTKTAGQY